jgi:hypothetical protein
VVQLRTTTEDLNCKGFWRYDKGPSAEEETRGTTEDHNSRLPAEKDTGGATEDRQQKTILEV